MKNKEQTVAVYEAPQIEVIEVEVEKGFAGSDNTKMGINDLEEENW